MRNRGARLTLLVLFIVTLGTTAYLFWNGEALARREAAALRSFDNGIRDISRALLEVRAAQQAYIAAGQGGEFWPGKVAERIDAARETLASLLPTATSQTAAQELAGARSALEDFAQLDRRVRAFTTTGQNLLASDLIFGDGLEKLALIQSRVDQARMAEIASRDALTSTYRSRQVFALAAAAAAASLVVLLLLSAPESESPVPAAARPMLDIGSTRPDPAPKPASNAEVEGWNPPKRLTVVPRPEPQEETAPTPAALPEAEPPATTAIHPAPAVAPYTDFNGVAVLCTDLARMIDTEELPALLDRASKLLDAKGIILWVADPDRRELAPVVAHGYAPQLVDRLGSIPREAENATAAAFRTSLLQTVKAAGGTDGAIAAPLVTGSGCVGVMAAEVKNEGEQEESRLAAAAIVAAQLATLIGPSAQGTSRAEAAGA